MDSCRICLATKGKDILLKTEVEELDKTYFEIMFFCLGIQISRENKTLKLCLKCYEKIISFCKFKILALKNDAYLRTVDVNCTVKLEASTEHKDVDYMWTNDNSAGEVLSSDDKPKVRKDTLEENLESFWFPDIYQSNITKHVKIESRVEHDIHSLKNYEFRITKEIEDDQNINDSKHLLYNNVHSSNSCEFHIKKDIKNEENIANFPWLLDDELFICSKLNKGKKEKELKKKSQPISSDKIKKKVGRTKSITEGDKKKVCQECGQHVFNLKLHLTRHMSVEQREKYKCEDCTKEYLTKWALAAHLRIKHLNMKSRCDICGKEVINLRNHNLIKHETKKFKWTCQMCGVKFFRKSHLDIHMDRHSNKRPYECEICKATFVTKGSLTQHRHTVHEKHRPHLCHYCSKSYPAKHALEVHIRSHTNEKPFNCEECGKKFTKRNTLKGHMILHSGERNYQCQFCDRKFAAKGNLNTHLLSHTKEKNHPCKYCGVKFRRADHRNRHQFTAHEKNFIGTPATYAANGFQFQTQLPPSH